MGSLADVLNAAAAVNYGGLANECFFFIPLIHKYGRRPLYIFSAALQFAACIWQAKTNSVGDFIGGNLISGLEGCDQRDRGPGHHRGSVLCSSTCHHERLSTGAFLGPVAAGYVVNSQGWRRMWWRCVIFMGMTLLCVIFFFEESKFVALLDGQDVALASQDSPMEKLDEKKQAAGEKHTYTVASQASTNQDITPKSYFQRIALITLIKDSI
ncbi:Major facilitator superfamily domain general substrate transporter [Penicillium capsulatum]|uniref:Major facilitator superfamily domain general substrate transporter n=1 Tax=Penicillium capsulatum TaxID=69766 RepID=A0A9W9IRI7_9EURO|nr:Major facilitator superfamily domain general substrate transporter [Penicillium capsulatum]KAJ6129960.1 Major facilitator superfamily domain general substrate transporter [Penicillium capsulatum]